MDNIINITKKFHNLCYACWEALEITEYTGKDISEHIRDLVTENKKLKNKLNRIKSLASVKLL